MPSCCVIYLILKMTDENEHVYRKKKISFIFKTHAGVTNSIRKTNVFSNPLRCKEV
jgi:hypothetical protein